MKDKKVWIQYAAGPPCGPEKESAWQVERDTVIDLTIYFGDDQPLAELKLDLSKFIRTTDDHLIGWVYYTNVTEGIWVQGSDRTVTALTYFGEARDQTLRCPRARAEQALGADSP